MELKTSKDGQIDVYEQMFKPILLIISTFLSLGMVIGIGFLFFKQTMFILTNVTTLENIIFPNKYENPYYSKTSMANFRIYLGNSPVEWFSLEAPKLVVKEDPTEPHNYLELDTAEFEKEEEFDMEELNI